MSVRASFKWVWWLVGLSVIGLSGCGQVKNTASPKPTFAIPTIDPTFVGPQAGWATQAAFEAYKREVLKQFPAIDPDTGLWSCPAGCFVGMDSCTIKGDISPDSGEKTYYVQGQAFYSEITIDSDNGERWFCTEDEATANGWQKSSK